MRHGEAPAGASSMAVSLVTGASRRSATAILRLDRGNARFSRGIARRTVALRRGAAILACDGVRCRQGPGRPSGETSSAVARDEIRRPSGRAPQSLEATSVVRAAAYGVSWTTPVVVADDPGRAPARRPAVSWTTGVVAGTIGAVANDGLVRPGGRPGSSAGRWVASSGRRAASPETAPGLARTTWGVP